MHVHGAMILSRHTTKVFIAFLVACLQDVHLPLELPLGDHALPEVHGDNQDA